MMPFRFANGWAMAQFMPLMIPLTITLNESTMALTTPLKIWPPHWKTDFTRHQASPKIWPK